MDYNIAHKEEKSREMGTIYMALDAVTKYVAEWLDKNLKTLDSDYWNRYVMTALFPAQQETVKANGAKTVFDLDQPTILSVFLQNKSVLVRELGVDPQLFGYAHSIKDIRNKYFHKNSKPLPQKRFKHDIETIVLFLDGLGAGQEIMDGIRNDLGSEEKSSVKHESIKPVKITVSTVAHATPRNTSSASQTPSSSVKETAPKSAEEVKPQAKSISLPFDTKRYPQTIQDRLNARQIVGFRVETLFGEEAERLYVECKASDCGYDLATVHFAVLAKRGPESTDSVLDVKGKLDRGFVGLIPGFQKAIIISAEDALVWFFGSKEQVKPVVESNPVKLVPAPTLGPTPIPQWFQHAIHADDLPYLSVEEVQTTMALSQRDVDRYAKTYSPRSFAEGVLSGKSIPEQFRQEISKAGMFSMLDVGCGTAAISLGVIHGLDRIIDKSTACSVKLDLVDGNTWMLNKARDFVSARASARVNGITAITAELIERKIMKVSDCFPKQSYDLIVTSKFLGELVCRGMKDVFKAFLSEAVRHIRSGGQIVLIEVPKHRDQIEAAIKGLPKNIGNVFMRDMEVHPAFMGSESTDSEIVLSVLISK